MVKAKRVTAKKPKKEEGHPKSRYLFWYEKMQLIRMFEQKSSQLYGQQKIRGFCHLYIGQEANAVGAVTALSKDDKWITAYRDHGHPLALGTSPKGVMAELYGKATGISKGKGGSMHLFDKEVNFFGGHGIVGGQIPLGAGIAFAEKYQKTGNICICFMGDGAVRQGAFHESFNLAKTWGLPVVFVVENNGYAMGTSVERTSNVIDLCQLGEAYSMPSKAIDAMKIEEVHDEIEKAAKRARSGGGPTFLEFRTYRYKGHSMSDPAKYRTKEEVEEHKAHDSIVQVKKTILLKKFASQGQLDKIDEKIQREIQEAVDFAEESPWPEASDTYADIYREENYPFIIEE
jgi:pyruvate dehydrogenase E1 component subunit alpha